jgi:hypothetical protein
MPASSGLPGGPLRPGTRPAAPGGPAVVTGPPLQPTGASPSSGRRPPGPGPAAPLARLPRRLTARPLRPLEPGPDPVGGRSPGDPAPGADSGWRAETPSRRTSSGPAPATGGYPDRPRAGGGVTTPDGAGRGGDPSGPRAPGTELARQPSWGRQGLRPAPHPADASGSPAPGGGRARGLRTGAASVPAGAPADPGAGGRPAAPRPAPARLPARPAAGTVIAHPGEGTSPERPTQVPDPGLHPAGPFAERPGPAPGPVVAAPPRAGPRGQPPRTSERTLRPGATPESDAAGGPTTSPVMPASPPTPAVPSPDAGDTVPASADASDDHPATPGRRRPGRADEAAPPPDPFRDTERTTALRPAPEGSHPRGRSEGTGEPDRSPEQRILIEIGRVEIRTRPARPSDPAPAPVRTPARSHVISPGLTFLRSW